MPCAAISTKFAYSGGGGTIHNPAGSFLADARRDEYDGAISPRTHTCVAIATVVGGQGRQVSALGRQDLAAGEVVLLRPGAWHGYENCRALRVWTLLLDPGLMRQELSWAWDDPLLGYLLKDGPYAPKQHGILMFRLSDDALERCATRFQAITELRREPLMRYRGDLIGQVTLLLTELARAADDARDPRELLSTSHVHETVREAMQLLEPRLAHPWTLDGLADALHVSPNYLIRIFKAATGLPPIAYLTRQRIETAALLLINTQETVAQIGASVGWPDQNYFARRFRSHFGLSPSAYRSRGIRN